MDRHQISGWSTCGLMDCHHIGVSEAPGLMHRWIEGALLWCTSPNGFCTLWKLDKVRF